MEQSDSVDRKRQTLIYLLIAVAAVSVYVFYLPVWSYFVGQESPRLLEEFVREAATAISIAAVVGVLFEYISSRQLIGDASDRIAVRVMAQHLPKGFEAQIRQIVHSTTVVMEDWATDYRLIDGGDHVRVILESRYRAKNYASFPEIYQPSNGEEQNYSPKFTLLEVVHKGKQVPCAIEPKPEPVSGAPKVMGPKVKLAAHGKAGDSCTVHWRFEMTMPRDYTYIQTFGRAGVNPRITVSQSEGFTFTATVEGTSESTPTSWTYERAYLPGQHIRVWWRPTKK